MMRILTIFGLLSLAIAANAALFLRSEEDAQPVAGTTRATIGGTMILLPRAMVREQAQWAGGRLDRLDLWMRADDLGPMPPVSAKSPLQPLPERITMTLTPANAASRPSDKFQLIYSRFISSETRSQPNGLVTRRFRPGTPFEDREIHIGAGTGRIFYAMCPKPERVVIEPCTAELLVGTIAAEIRFAPVLLADWRRLSTESVKLIEGWRHAANPNATNPAQGKATPES